MFTFKTEIHPRVRLNLDPLARGIRQVVASKDSEGSADLFDQWHIYINLLCEAVKGDERAPLESGAYALFIASEETKEEIKEEILKTIIQVSPCDPSLIFAYETYPNFKASYLSMLQLQWLKDHPGCTSRQDELTAFSNSIKQGESGPVRIF